MDSKREKLGDDSVSVDKKRKSSPAKSPMASKKQKLAQGDDSTCVSEASPTKTIVKVLPEKHPQKPTLAQRTRLHESSSSDTCKLPAKIQATAVTTGATVKKAGSSASETSDTSDDVKVGIKMVSLPVKANAVRDKNTAKVNANSGTSDSDADFESKDDENDTKTKKVTKMKPNATVSKNASSLSSEESCSEEEVSKEEVSQKATSQHKTVTPTATPKAVSASKSVTPKVAKESHNLQRKSSALRRVKSAAVELDPSLQGKQSSESERSAEVPLIAGVCADKEYLELKKDIKDIERKIEDHMEDYQRLLDKVDLTASEKYRKDNFERRLADLKKQEDFWMSHMKILEQKTVAPTGTVKQSTPVSEESISEKLTDSEEKLQKKQSSESERSAEVPLIAGACADKEYLELKKDIKDIERKIEDIEKDIKDLEEEYQRLLDKSDLTASEKYRKASFERKLTRIDELEKDKDELKKQEDFWMSRMKILEQKTVAPTGTLKQSTQSSQVKRYKERADGIDVNGYYLDRPHLVKQVISMFETSQFVLIISPPATGKTSLCDLLIKNSNYLCVYISCLGGRFSPKKFLEGKAVDSMNKEYNLYTINECCIVMLDDSQKIYKETFFWEAFMKDGYHIFPSNISFLIVATHVLDSEDLESPIQFKGRPRLDRKHLLLSENEAIFFLTSNDLGLPYAMQSPDVITYIVKDCAGVIGAMQIYVEAIMKAFPKDLPSTTDLLCFFLDTDFMKLFERCFGITKLKNIHKDLVYRLGEALYTKQIISHALQETNERCLTILQKSGFLLEIKDAILEFTSPLAKRYVSSMLYPNRSTSETPSNIYDLVKKVIQNMSSSDLLNSCAHSDFFPKEGSFQHLFCKGLLQCTPATVKVCSELSHIYPFVETHSTEIKRIRGAIDFFLDGGLRWGIELMVSGGNSARKDKRTEHLKRIKEGGKYYPLKLKESVVVDFQCRSSEDIANITTDDDLITVLFHARDFSKCVCQFRKEKEPVTLTLMP